MSLYLSRLVLNPGSAWARADLQSRYDLHRTVSRGFGGDPDAFREARCLFRLDEHPAPARVLVQSRAAPEWSGLRSGYLARAPEVKEIDPLFRSEQRLRFLLVANPTKREPGRHALREDGTPKDGTRRALVFDDARETEAACAAWLGRKAAAGGFQVRQVSIEDAGVVRVQKGSSSLSYAAIRFEGVLEVTDPGCFFETLQEGIGSAKGFGFGLLSLAPAR